MQPELETKSGVRFLPYALYSPHEDSPYVGGIGVTDHDLAMTCSLFGPEMKEQLCHARGLVAFVGNGTSIAALELQKEQKALGITPSKILLIDMINMYDLYDDLKANPRHPELEHTHALIEAEKRGDVILLQSFIGVDRTPDEYKAKVSLMINRGGPSIQTLPFLAEYLINEGLLYMSYTNPMLHTSILRVSKQGDIFHQEFLHKVKAKK